MYSSFCADEFISNKKGIVMHHKLYLLPLALLFLWQNNNSAMDQQALIPYNNNNQPIRLPAHYNHSKSTEYFLSAFDILIKMPKAIYNSIPKNIFSSQEQSPWIDLLTTAIENHQEVSIIIKILKQATLAHKCLGDAINPLPLKNGYPYDLLQTALELNHATFINALIAHKITVDESLPQKIVLACKKNDFTRIDLQQRLAYWENTTEILTALENRIDEQRREPKH